MTDQGYVWLVGHTCRSKSVGTGLAYRLYACSVYDTKAPLQLWYTDCGAK